MLWLCKVYAIAFNTPYGDKVATGSFDKTARLWDANTGDCCYQLRGELTLPASAGCVWTLAQQVHLQLALGYGTRFPLPRLEQQHARTVHITPRRSCQAAPTSAGLQAGAVQTLSVLAGSTWALQGWQVHSAAVLLERDFVV
jgi:hypothetical protein